jgi:hypothetical protein
MGHKIRELMDKLGMNEPLEGHVEIDESYVGDKKRGGKRRRTVRATACMGSVPKQDTKALCVGCTRPTENSATYSGDCLCDRCVAVLWAAQALLDNGYGDEQKIAPTVVFGALSGEEPLLEEFRESLATAGWKSERGKEIRRRFGQTFEPYSVWAVADGVPIVHQDLIRVAGQHEHGTEEIEKIIIDIADISAAPEQVAEEYKTMLSLLGLNDHFSEEAEIGWQIAAGVIHMMVWPKLMDPDMSAIKHYLTKPNVREPSFPPSDLVGEVYSVLRGSKAKGKFRGYGRSVLPGNLTNKPEGKTLVPACVAWYLAGCQKPAHHEVKLRIVELLNRHLLAPCGMEEISDGGSDFIQLWGNVSKRAEHLERIEQGVLGILRRSTFVSNFFSPPENR